jgi:Tol biopolymer transport system component
MEEKLMPDFDTRKPQRPNETNRFRIPSVASKLRGLSVARTLRGLSMANGRRSLLLGGVLLLVVIAVLTGMFIYSYGGLSERPNVGSSVQPNCRLSERPNVGSSVQPNGKIAFVGGGDIHVVDPDGTNETRLTHTRKEEKDPVWSPDGEKLAFLRIDGHCVSIYVINSDGTNETRLTRATEGQLSELTWSPDGERLAFVHGSLYEDNNDIYTIDADRNLSGSKTRLTNTKRTENKTTSYSSPSWSPDGEKIAFRRNQRVVEERQSASASASVDSTASPEPVETSGTYVMNADGTDLGELPLEEGLGGSPSWSPDGEKIAVSTGTDIYTINSDGTDLTYLTGSPGLGLSPDWSPDGKQIAFSGQTITGKFENNYDIYVMNADGTGKTNITNTPAQEYNAAWSPDGKKIASDVHEPSGAMAIYVMNADGTGRIRVAEDLWGDSVAWGSRN